MKKILCALLVLFFMLTMLPEKIGGWNAPAMAAGPTVVKIAAGEAHSLALLSDGSLYAWGDNRYSQLGDGTNINRNSPVKIGTGYTAISAGRWHSLALKGNALYAWGNNGTGQLGDGTNINRSSPLLIGTGYTAIAAGGYHSLALKGNALYTWGNNNCGQLGDGTYINKKTPVQIGTGYTTIAAGSHISLALKGNVLYSWGVDYNENVDDYEYGYICKPVQIGTGFTAITAGGYHCLALKGSTIYAWGAADRENGFGQTWFKPLGATGYTAIAAGGYHSLAIKENVLYAWGRSWEGQLGDGTDDEEEKPPVQVGTGYTAIAAGYYHSLAIKGNTLFSWGNNEFGQLGDGTNINRSSPTRITFFDDLPDSASVPETGVKINPTSAALSAGDSFALFATISPSNATNKNVTWSSSNNSIATVASGGIVTGVKAGKATITVKTANGKMAKCAVTVLPLPTKVTLNRKTAIITIGNSITLKATVTPSNAVYKTVTWTSNYNRTAIVSSNGKVTGVDAGSVTITATTVNGFKAKCTVKVNYATATGVSLDKTSATLMIGDTLTLKSTVKPSSADPSVIWSSSNSKIVVVISEGEREGEITAIMKGTATITVKTNNGKTAKCVVTVLPN